LRESDHYASGEGLVGCCLCECAFDESDDALVEKFAAAREALARGFFGEVERFGDALDGLVFAIEKDQRLAVGFRDMFERLPKDGLFFFGDGVFGWVGGGSRAGQVFIELVRGGKRIADLFSRGIVDEVARDAEEPAFEFGGFFKVAEFAPGDDKCFLGKVFAPADVATTAVGEGGDGVLVFGDELGESIAVASEDGFHEARVVGYGRCRDDV